ncbi:MAG TPA: BMP family ABC transporter substrate-binding protein [Burkholderiaceae bacterium]|nr:BMP family ABC transporter substrate-binding protein [Burkholderiaceae bacterium]
MAGSATRVGGAASAQQLTAPSSRPAATGTPLRVGFVFVSPIADAGWTYQHNLGRLHLEQTLGAQVATRFVEKVQEGPDAERVIRDLAAQGHPLIFATSFGYMEPTVRVAREFPKVAFEHATGYKTGPNLATYNARFYEGRYLAGLLAGAATRSNTLGYVAAFPIPEVLQGINAFTLGARAVNPQVQTRVIWTNTWFDPGRERDAAFTLISQGADVLTHHTDSSAVPQAAEARGAWAVGYHSDMSKAAPTRHLVSVTHHWGPYYVQRARAVLEGAWKPHSVWGGMSEGFVKVEAVSTALAQEARERMRAAEREIIDGRLHPFTGPLRDNDGKVRLESGAMSDQALQRMDWFVEGVVGRVPRN